MKGQKLSKTPRLSTISGIAGLVLAVSLLHSPAAPITLVHNNSSVDIDPFSSAGMFNWNVDGRDQLAQQWFWFRVGGAGPEAPINTISAPTLSSPNARTLTTSYGNGVYGIDITYVLTGQSAGSGLSGIAESIRLTNFTANPIDFHFFQYSDFDIEGGPNSVALGKDIFGRFNEAIISSGPNVLSETVATPGANHGEAALFPFTLNRLNDGVATTLNDSTGAGPGDVAWAFEWDFTLSGFGSFAISKEKSLQIPEPSVAALLVTGIVGLALRRRARTGK